MVYKQGPLGMRNIKTIEDLKLMGVSSLPADQKVYLHLYTLEKERYRLKQEYSMHEEKKKILSKRVNIITAKMADLQKKIF